MNVTLWRVGFYATLYPAMFLVGLLIGILLVQYTGFYVESWGVGCDYFFLDWVNWDYCLTGGL